MAPLNYIGKPQPPNRPQNLNLNIGLINGEWKATKFRRRYTTYRGMMTAYRNYKRSNNLINLVLEIDYKVGKFIIEGQYI